MRPGESEEHLVLAGDCYEEDHRGYEGWENDTHEKGGRNLYSDANRTDPVANFGCAEC